MNSKVCQLFDYVRNYIIAEGGDGWGLIISNNYIKLADLFEENEKEQEQGIWFFDRIEHEGRINYINGQESITFMDSSPENINLSGYELAGYEIVVKVDNILGY